MCNGSIMDKLISFALPLMLSGVLQLMFNAVDIIVVGRFSGSQALAAVGSQCLRIYLSGFLWEQMYWGQGFMLPAVIRRCQRPYILPLHWL